VSFILSPEKESQYALNRRLAGTQTCSSCYAVKNPNSAGNRTLDLTARSLVTIAGTILAVIASKTGKQLSVFVCFITDHYFFRSTALNAEIHACVLLCVCYSKVVDIIP
jgi:hypothetical protein